MEKITVLNGQVVPLIMKNVDTDLIIPAQYMTSVSREGYGEHLFERLRQADSNFIVDQPRFSGATIIVADENFGSGSSREHAVWALQGRGFRCVIAKSFADIFFNNSAKNGLLLIKLPEETVNKLQQAALGGELVVEIDLARQTICAGQGEVIPFAYDEFRKYCLLNGLDDIDYLLSHQSTIEQYRKNREQYDFLNKMTVR